MLVVQVSLGKEHVLSSKLLKCIGQKYSSIFVSNNRKQLLEKTELESILVFTNFIAEYKGKKCPCEGSQTLKEDAQRGHKISILGDTKNRTRPLAT